MCKVSGTISMLCGVCWDSDICCLLHSRLTQPADLAFVARHLWVECAISPLVHKRAKIKPAKPCDRGADRRAGGAWRVNGGGFQPRAESRSSFTPATRRFNLRQKRGALPRTGIAHARPGF